MRFHHYLPKYNFIFYIFRRQLTKIPSFVSDTFLPDSPQILTGFPVCLLTFHGEFWLVVLPYTLLAMFLTAWAAVALRKSIEKREMNRWKPKFTVVLVLHTPFTDPKRPVHLDQTVSLVLPKCWGSCYFRLNSSALWVWPSPLNNFKILEINSSFSDSSTI